MRTQLNKQINVQNKERIAYWEVPLGLSEILVTC